MRRLMGDALSVSEGISAIAELIPDSVALSHGNQQLTYGELDRRADLFAAYLAQCGISPGGTVAICLERSFDWIVAALGTMRAGAAYVPLDPAWPDSRCRFALKDSASTLLVARAALLDRLEIAGGGVDPKRDAELIAASAAFAQVSMDPRSLAYVIYTSGSTGTPKGVEITHANLNNLARWHRTAFSVKPGDRASHLAGLGFDATAWELWPNLCAGATICLAEDTVRSSALLLRDWLIRDRMSISFVPTVHAASMMSMDWPAATELRFMLTGGDVLHQGPAQGLPFQVVNNYGPTECTVVATSSALQAGGTGRPTIGRPILGAVIYLLDEHGEQVADGLSGEIYIGGDGVGRGYRNLPESTERCFVPDPFCGLEGKRMYRSGDRGVRRPDGQLEFCGRSDRQVKIRGQRVELDEISAVLSRHPAIEFATVSFKAAEGGQSHLVAYVLPKEGVRPCGVAELQKFLQLNLPDYMIPSVFMELNSLPLSPGAKVDTTLMAVPENMRSLDERAEAAADLTIDNKLLAMFREILQRPSMTVDDNFFLAGGHSLLGMQLVTRLDKTFGVDLTFQEIFETATVTSLAPVVSARLRENRLRLIWEDLLGRKQATSHENFFAQGGDASLLRALRQGIIKEFGRDLDLAALFDNPTIKLQAELLGRNGISRSTLPLGVCLVHRLGTRQKIFWLHTLPIPLAQELGEDQPFYFVIFTEKDVSSLGESPSMQEIAASVVHKIVGTQPRGPYVIGGKCIGAVLAYEVASQLRDAGEVVSLLLMIDAPTPTYVKLSTALITKLKHPRFYLYRAAQVIGWRESLANLWRRVFKRAPGLMRSSFRKEEQLAAQRMIVKAAFDYRLPKYDGKTLLLMAKERDPVFDFLPAWQSLTSDLEAFYVQGRHLDLITSDNVPEIANHVQNSLRQCSATTHPVDVNSWTARP